MRRLSLAHEVSSGGVHTFSDNHNRQRDKALDDLILESELKNVSRHHWEYFLKEPEEWNQDNMILLKK